MQEPKSSFENTQNLDKLEPDKENEQKEKMQKQQKIKNKNEKQQKSKNSSKQATQRSIKQKKAQRQSNQNNIQTSLSKISIQSPVKKSLTKSDIKINQKQNTYSTKTNQKMQISQVKEKNQEQSNFNSKATLQSNMKSTIKSIHKSKTINKPFYEETFYITGMKQNYLLLLSDNNQVLEFPIGMFTTHGETHQGQQHEENLNKGQNFHLIKDIKIGQPIKIKLEFDFLRQQKDDKIFHSLQKSINQQYAQPQEPAQPRGKQLSIKRTK